MSESEYQESLERIASAARRRIAAEQRMTGTKADHDDAKAEYKDACEHERKVIADAMAELPLFPRHGRDAPGNAQEAQEDASEGES
jgi:TPR repeat protein